jgi:dTDP-3-amino-3,4,6-trideoxy-alpha-D-glucose transaminase
MIAEPGCGGVGEASPIMPDAPRIVALPVFRNARGLLGVIEFAQDLGFTPRRFYFIRDVPTAMLRGVHAHRTLRQCMLCLEGAVTIEVERQGKRYVFRLDRPEQALIIPPGCWRVLRDFVTGTVVGVLASREFNQSDYIYEYEDFRRWEEKTRADRGVPYLDLSRTVTALESEIDAALARVVRSGRYIGGSEVAAFERGFAEYCGAEHAIGVGNGLDALTLALQAHGIGHGHSVVVPASSFIATALAVSRTGARPIFVDVDIDTANLDPQAAAAAVRSDTRAIIAVHLYGHPADMDPLRSVAHSHGLFLLEDAAQAHGACYRDRRCGSLGAAAAFSFYPTKNLGALGDAGAVLTSDPVLARQVRMLGNYGAEQKDHHLIQGTNSRLDPIQAAVLSVKLRHLDGWNARRRTLAERYRAGLAGLDDVLLPSERPWATSAWHVFAIRVPGCRDALMRHLQAAAIGTNLHYPRPMHLQPAYRGIAPPPGACPVAERLARETLSLPLEPFHSDEEIDTVIGSIRGFFH